MNDKLKIKEYKIRYLGTNPFDQRALEKVLLNNNFDDLGIIEIEETKPTIELCPDCTGLGNVDISAGFPLDCTTCKGSGWIKKGDE